jgi:lysophospholipase L1-like esterase
MGPERAARRPDASSAHPSQPGRPGLLAIHALLVGAVALLTAQIVLQAENTLHRNGRWTSVKMQPDRGLIGAVAAYVTRPPLRRNQLDLGAYFGFQQLLHSEARPVDRLDLSFSAESPAYLDVLFGTDPRKLDGVRLSLHADFPSLRFASTLEGAFIESEELELGDRLEEGWNRVRLRFEPGGARIEINEAPPLSAPRRPGAVHTVGFRGSRDGPLVDDVEVGFGSDAAPLIESFANRRGWVGYVAIAAVITAAIGTLIHLALRRWAGFEALPAHLGCFTGYLVVLVCVAAYAAVDYFHLSGLYPADSRTMEAAGYPNRIEGAEVAVRRIRREIGALASDGRLRILLIGTSQSWGAGALRPEDVWGRVLERELNERFSAEGRGFVVVNTAIPGLQAPGLLELYRREWQKAKPDLVIINLGHNDRRGPAFGAALQGFVATNRARGIPTVFIPEPNASGGPIRSRLRRNHEIIREVARALDVPVIDAHAWLRQRRDSGFLWWDGIHLTSYGQRLLGEHVASELVPILRSLRSDSSQSAGSGSSSRAESRAPPSLPAKR